MKSKMKKIEKANETETGNLEGKKNNNKINIPLARWIKKRHKSPISAMKQASQHRSLTHKNKDNKDTLKTILH